MRVMNPRFCIVLAGLLVSTLAKVDLATTRGGVHRIQQKKIGIGDFGDPGVEVLTRFGFRHQKHPPPVLYDLPELE